MTRPPYTGPLIIEWRVLTDGAYRWVLSHRTVPAADEVRFWDGKRRVATYSHSNMAWRYQGGDTGLSDDPKADLPWGTGDDLIAFVTDWAANNTAPCACNDHAECSECAERWHATGGHDPGCATLKMVPYPCDCQGT